MQSPQKKHRHSERSEEPLYFAFAIAVVFAFLAVTIAPAQSPLGNAHWIAAPFSTPRDGAEPDGSRPMPIFSREFTVGANLTKAELRIAGLGQFEAHINSKLVGQPGLHQAWTDYKKSITFETYNIITQLHEGTNAIGVMLGNGMYNVQKTKGRYTKFEGTFGPPKLIAELRLIYADGHTETIVTDNHWKTAPGPITFDSTYGGEDYDGRKVPPDWDRLGFNDSAWTDASLVDGPGGSLIPAITPEVIQTEALRPIKTTTVGDKTIYDLGRNVAGIPSIRVFGPGHGVLKITPGELLKPDGTVSQASSGGPMWWTYTTSGRPMTGTRTTSGSLEEEDWTPSFGYYGFRYLQLEWIEADPSPAAYSVELSVSPLTFALPSTSSFTTSNPLLNSIHSLILAAIHNNEVSIFTDCPHREKLGWLEQTHLMAPGLMFNNDLRGLYAATARNIADAQHPDGDVPTIAPQYTRFGPAYPVYDDSPEWGSASILAPWYAYKFYGDKSQLATAYPVMQRYIAFLQTKAVNGIVAYGLGDWYDVGPKPPGFSQLTTLGVTATLMLYEDAATMEKIATLLNHPEDAAQYRTLAAKEKESFNAKFLNPATGIYDTGSQTAQAMPLALNIVPEASKPKVLAALIADIKAHNNHTTSGEIGFPYELRALMENDQDYLIYQMLTRTDAPSYGSQLAAGATALTEAWDANPRNSQDHFMLGAAEEWFYRGLAGIDIDLSRDSDQHIIIRPVAPDSLDSVKATYASTLGPITVEWRHQAANLNLEVTIPVRATLILPNQPPRIIEPGHHSLSIP